MSQQTLSQHMLVLGAAASGKSAYAEAQVLAQGRAPLYIATAQSYDIEMERKISDHKARRDSRWHTIEAPIDLAAALDTATEENAALIDCATLWLTNLMLSEADIQTAETSLIDALKRCPCPVTIVSNDVGGGITPDNAMARRFQRLQGGFNQRLAAAVGHVVLVTAGLPHVLKAPA